LRHHNGVGWVEQREAQHQRTPMLGFIAFSPTYECQSTCSSSSRVRASGKGRKHLHHGFARMRTDFSLIRGYPRQSASNALCVRCKETEKAP
jgi:hypothetical protein